MDELKRWVEEQCRAFESLAASLEGEDRFRDLRRREEKPCEASSSLVAGVGEGFVLSRHEKRSLFLQYVEFKRYESADALDMLNYIGSFVKTPITAQTDFAAASKIYPAFIGKQGMLNLEF